MISIIVASANPDLLSRFKVNTETTIGVAYEIIVFDNANGQKGLCELYNEGARRASFDLLCFAHEDIRFETDNWGRTVVASFSDNNRLGLMGVAGGAYKSLAPSSWFCYDGYPWLHHISVVQQFKHDLGRPDTNHSLQYRADTVKKVATLDGVLLFSKKNIIRDHPFDERLLTGFHGYDIDISLTIGQFYDVAATTQLLITHFSDGNYSLDWFKSTVQVHRKWKPLLPRTNENLTKKQVRFLEKRNMRFILYLAKKLGVSMLERLQLLWNSKLYRLIGWPTFLSLHKELIKKRDYQF